MVFTRKDGGFHGRLLLVLPEGTVYHQYAARSDSYGKKPFRIQHEVFLGTEVWERLLGDNFWEDPDIRAWRPGKIHVSNEGNGTPEAIFVDGNGQLFFFSKFCCI